MSPRSTSIRSYAKASSIEGSRALSSPYSSYLSLAAEIGLLGLALMVGVYLAAFFAASASRDS